MLKKLDLDPKSCPTESKVTYNYAHRLYCAIELHTLASLCYRAIHTGLTAIIEL